MKSTFIALVASLGLMSASVASADDFDNSAYSLVMTSGNLEFTLDGTVNDDITDITTGAYFLDHKLGSFDSVVFASLGYDRLNDELDLGVEYRVSRDFSMFSVYGDLSAEYRTPTVDLSAGDVFVGPTVGASYTINSILDVFAEASYEWNASDDWMKQGGLIEAGVDFVITPSLAVTPSITRTFDTGNDHTQFKIETTLRF